MSTMAPPAPAKASEAVVPACPGEQRLLLRDVSWHSYVTIGDALPDRPALHMTYDRGSLELMTTSTAHEVYKKWLGRFVETIAEECNLAIALAGNMTFRREDLAQGLEPDDCYWIRNEPHMRGRLEWEPTRDPPPDLAVEIEVSRSALNRMAIYAALCVPEVWRFNGQTLQVHLLQADGTYQIAERSLAFPDIPATELVRFLQPDQITDYLSVIRALRTWLREQLKKP